MAKDKIKKFRLTDLQLEQLQQQLEKENANFTDFIHSLIEREVMQDAVTVQQHLEKVKPVRTKVKTVVEVVKRYQKTDPALLLELAKIGNNINQIARALNIIKNADPLEQRKLDISLPKISRQRPERLQKQLKDLQLEEEKTTAEPKSIDLAEVDESAY